MTQAIAQPTHEMLPIAQIRRDGGTQPRSRLNEEVVAEYAEDMQNGRIFPPVVVYYDGQDYWLADGFHRVKAAEQAGLESIAVDLRHGTRRDAVLFSVGANAAHGLRRTNADKRRAVIRLLSDPEWSKWSNREIARHCAVTEGFVRRIKGELSAYSTKIDQTYATQRFGADMQTVKEAKQRLEEQSAERYAQRGGTTYLINTAKIGSGIVAGPEDTTASVTEVNESIKPPPANFPEPATPPVPLPPPPLEHTRPPAAYPLAPLRTIPGQRQRAKEPPKPEILSVQQQERSIVVQPRTVKAGSVWKLGKSQLLYCGKVEDSGFQKLLPRRIELFLRVVPSLDGASQSVPDGTVSGLILFTPYGGERDLRLFRELVQNAIDLYTDPGENVVLAGLPDSSLFILMDELEARCFCAEPDPKRCEEALAAWTAIGKQVERG
jgi:hypothetical protein